MSHSILTNHVLVDFENVCEIDPSILEKKNFSLVIFIGAGRTTLDLGLVEQLLIHAASVQLVRLKSRGRNALDFTLAYYLGCCATADPNGFFHIVSKDKGFDPLVEHLQSKHIRVCRHDDFSTLSFSVRSNSLIEEPASQSLSQKDQESVQPRSTSSRGDRTRHVMERLQRMLTNRPKTRKKLIGFIMSQLGNGSSESQAEVVITELSQSGLIYIDPKGAVTYRPETE